MTIDTRSIITLRSVGCSAVLAVLCAAPLAIADSQASQPRGFERFQARCGETTAARAVAIPEAIRAPRPGEPVWGWEPLVLATPDWVYETAFCFSPIDPPSLEVIEQLEAFMRGPQDRYSPPQPRWSPGAQGTPSISLTWSFIPNTVNISGDGFPAANSNLFTVMDAQFAAEGGRAVWIAQFQSVFDRWAMLSGTSYTRITSGGNDWDDGAGWGTPGDDINRGDIRIGMKPIDGVSGILAYNAFPQNGDMVLDSAETWDSNSPATFRFLRNVVAHEHGHGLGLEHTCPNNGTKLLEPLASTAFDGPRHDELRAVHRLYGDEYGNNNTPATATPLGVMSAGESFTPSLVPAPSITNGAITSIDRDAEVDYFSFTTTEPVIANITVTPVGLNYPSYIESSCGSSANNVNSLSIANLAVQLIAADGVTVIREASSAAIGLAESLSNSLLSPVGTMYVRVYETSSPTESQLYSLAIIGLSTPTLTASDGTFGDRVRLTWSSFTAGAGFTFFRNTTADRGSATQIGTQASGTTFDDLTAAPGVTYFYWVEAAQGTATPRPFAGPDTGFVTAAAPGNNACASATDISAGLLGPVPLSGQYAGTLIGATNDGAASCGSSSSSPDVWYAFTAPACGGVLAISTCGTHDTGGVDAGTNTVVSILSACGGTELACNDDTACSNDAGVQRDASVSVTLAPSQSVRIRVSAPASAPAGPFTLNMFFSQANDACANATVVADGATPFCNTNANGGTPNSETGCGTFDHDLWFRYTAAATGTLNADICDTTFDSILAVYAGACPVANDTALSCASSNCGAGNLRGQLTAPVTSGSQYWIRVGGITGSGGRGSGTLNLSLTPAPPPCPLDITGNGVVDADDIFGFLNIWFAGPPGGTCTGCAADWDGDGNITADDIFSFLNAWFAFGPGSPCP